MRESILRESDAISHVDDLNRQGGPGVLTKITKQLRVFLVRKIGHPNYQMSRTEYSIC